MMIYTGKTANTLLHQNLEDRKSNICKGYFCQENRWIAFDNSTGNCWVEEFYTEEKAICWLENFFEISEIKNFEAIKISSQLIFIPNDGYLTTTYEKEILTLKFYPFLA
ncbi:MAG: hypothetical protein M0Q90_04445 [Bacteroidales bacterium]|nr:hypothetical protein [Bacteroidales bacterium]